MTYTLAREDIGTLTLEIVIREEYRKNSNVQVFAMPFSDSNQAVIFDIQGATKDISLEGEFKGTQDEIRNFLDKLDKLVNGDQFHTCTFHSDLLNKNLNVKIVDISYSYEGGEPNILRWTIKMTEGMNE